ncbi:YfhJ family protein [Bacillus changyiensis]|uniref:YfhJ family protein n=1 Tax=Bacillus changyiensis TaxID=3004103 RepID=UPI0022E8F85A|nr:YfhJ family protein [Bacillus changyiensis]MDA1478324.1 YfhJ family protein [Bacillus changyiensis]
MDIHFEKLANALLAKNHMLSYHQARTWVEHLWEDFEATFAKAGYSYQGKELTERVVLEWIEDNGSHLHLFQSDKASFKELFTTSDRLLH